MRLSQAEMLMLMINSAPLSFFTETETGVTLNRYALPPLFVLYIYIYIYTSYIFKIRSRYATHRQNSPYLSNERGYP